MPQIINTNVASLNAQRNLNRSQDSLQVSLQRLSSGLRINSAKDDAAGLAISNRMTAQVRGMNQAVRNASDAISLAQTGEGALQEVTNALQRMRELGVQARNATNTDDDRASLDNEFQQLMSEVDRLAETTAFNGKKILDGSFGNVAFQVGANVGETISLNISSSMRTNSIGSYASTSYNLNNVTGQAAATVGALTGDTLSVDVAGEIQLNNFNVQAAADGTAGRGDGSAFAIAAAINQDTDSHGVTAVAGETTATFTAAQIANFDLTTGDGGTDDTLTYTFNVNGTQITQQTEGAATITNADTLASAINNETNATGVSATVAQNGDLTLTASDGRNIEITEVIGGATDAADAVTGYFGNVLTGSGAVGTEAAGNIYKGAVSLSSDSGITTLTDDVANVVIFNGIADGGADVTAATTIDQSNLLTVSAIDDSIYRIDQALEDVDGLRGDFGAIQARFDSTIASLQAAAENTSAARSRILDADFAQETANLTRAQILQQAGVSVLSQANALPQGVLALLQ